MKHNIVTFVSLTAFALSGIIFWDNGFAWVVMASIGLIYISIIAYGSSQIKANYFINSINQGKKKSVALTFDDGPHPDRTPKILEILREKKVKATFFVIGKNAEKYPDLLRQIDNEGHIVANHSYSHSYLIAFFSTKRLTNDLSRCNDVVFQTIGKMPLLFRPPFGVTNPRYKTALAENGLESIGWSLRSFDTRAKSKYEVIDKVISKLKKGDIILFHDHLSVTSDALEDIIEHINTKKIDIEPLAKAINHEPYAKI